MNKPLQGRRVLVTRPADQARTLAALIEERGGEPVLFPLLEIAPADDPLPLQQAIARLDDYVMAIFISPNAVEMAVPSILARRPWPVHLRAAAIGPGTTARLAARGIAPVIAPVGRFDSEALLERPELAAAALAGRKVLLLRGNGGRELLAETLSERGAQVDAIACYRRSAPSDGDGLKAILRSGRIDALTLSSSEGLRNLLSLLDLEDEERVQAMPVFVPHRRIAETAAEHGLRHVILTAPADAGLVESLCAFAWTEE